MKILICVKQVPKGSNVKFDENNNLIREGLKMEMNLADKHAIQMALNVKNQLDNVTVDVLTMGLPSTQDMLKELGQYGIENGYIVTDKAFAGSDTLATSYTISQAIKYLGDYELIFCGVTSSDGVTGQVGPQIAQYLDVNLISYVKDFKIESNKIKATRLNGKYIEKIVSKLPALITVTMSSKSLEQSSKSFDNKDIIIHTLTNNDIKADEEHLGFKGSATCVSDGYVPEKLIECMIINEESCEKSVNKLFDILLEKKLVG